MRDVSLYSPALLDIFYHDLTGLTILEKAVHRHQKTHRTVGSMCFQVSYLLKN